MTCSVFLDAGSMDVDFTQFPLSSGFQLNLVNGNTSRKFEDDIEEKIFFIVFPASLLCPSVIIAPAKWPTTHSYNLHWTLIMLLNLTSSTP